MSLVYGKSSNGNYTLNIKNNGLFWDKLSYHRSLGDCYTLVGGTGLNSTDVTDKGISCIFNNASGKKVLVYFIDIDVIGKLTTGSSTISIETINSIPTGIYHSNADGNQCGNLLVGGALPTTLVSLKYGISNTDFTSDKVLFKEYIKHSSDSTDTDKSYKVNNYNEMIEIPYGYGIISRIQNANNTDNVTIQTGSTMKFIIVDENVDI